MMDPKTSHTTVELNQKIKTVEDALIQFMMLRQKLEENAEQVKSEIHTKMSIHMEQLHNREIQLLRQVDVFTSHQMALLQTQHAKLYHILGSLQSALVAKDKNINLTNVLEEMKSIDQIKNQSIPLLFWKADSASLQNIIHNFGVVDLSGGVLQFPLPQISKCLPSRIEEYEDGDHHVFYKTLEELKTQKEGLKLNASFPPFSANKADWLSRSSVSKDELNSQMKSFPHPSRAHLQNWLHQIKTQVELEPSSEEIDEFVMLTDATTSESIELISQPEVESFVNVSLSEPKFSFNQWMEPTQNWLSSDNKSSRCGKGECRYDKKYLEIENLGTQPCLLKSPIENEREFWLSKSVPAAENASFSCPIQKACRANEICQSFDECICEENCFLSYVKSGTSTPKLDKNVRDLLISPMVKIQESQQEQWLYSNEKMEQDKEKAQINDMEVSTGRENENSNKSISSNSVEDTPRFFDKHDSNLVSDTNKMNDIPQSKNAETWLPKVNAKSCIDPKTAIISMFEEYLQPPNMNSWLLTKSEQQQLTSDLLNKMKWLTMNSNFNTSMSLKNDLLNSLTNKNWLCN